VKYFLFTIGLFLLAGAIVASFLVREYRARDDDASRENKRVAFDDYSRAQFLSQNKLFIFAYGQVFGNRDKYKYFPPRILPTHTFNGRQGNSLFALVSSWNADTRILEVSSYLNTAMTIRFDPDTQNQMAFMPKLDATGRVKDFGENGIVTSSDSPKFATLFCQGDIVEIVTETAEALRQAAKDTPVVPVEIHLRQRLCTQ
jgi:hypothetical protein